MKINPSTKKFSFNPQDPKVMKPHSKDIEGVTSRNGIVSTDKVELRPYKITTLGGRPVWTRRDSKLKLRPNGDGDYVYPANQSNFTVANTFAATADTVKTFESKLSELTGKKINWAFREKKLGVSPTSGDWKNAYYARDKGGLFLFNFENKDGSKSSSGNSGEIVAHETGHAILDAMKPSWNRTNNPEIRAFHESFGDMLATLMSLKDEAVLERLVDKTGGDLRGGPKSQSNLVSEMGEELGGQVGIRSAYNDFHYKSPSQLPKRGNATQLGREAHDFSRLFSGAFYEILDGVSDSYRAEGQSPTEALRSAADEGMTMLVGMLEKSPSTGGSFRSMAKSMIDGDAEFNGGKRQDVLSDVFSRREIFTPTNLATTIAAAPGQNKEIILGADFGELAGVHVADYVEPGIGLNANGQGGQIEENVRLLQQDDDILLTKPGDSPEVGDFIKEDGSAYTSYVQWDNQGQASLLPSPYFFS